MLFPLCVDMWNIYLNCSVLIIPKHHLLNLLQDFPFAQCIHPLNVSPGHPKSQYALYFEARMVVLFWSCRHPKHQVHITGLSTSWFLQCMSENWIRQQRSGFREMYQSCQSIKFKYYNITTCAILIQRVSGVAFSIILFLELINHHNHFFIENTVMNLSCKSGLPHCCVVDGTSSFIWCFSIVQS